MTTLRTACPLDCPDGCTLEVEVTDGRLVSVDAAPDDPTDLTINPLTQGFICKKVKGHAARVHGSDRVLTPLIRTGPKGAAAFREASWDEALDLVASRIAEAVADDPATVVPYLYNSSAGELATGLLARRFWAALGATEVDLTICAATAGAAWEMTFGAMRGADLLDVVHAQLVVVWGANPAISNTHFPPLVQQARANGAALVVVDPRRTAMARRADLHLAVRPGTDVVLALAAASELERRRAVDTAFTGRHAVGVEPYLDGCREWTVERAAETCGIGADEVAALVDLLTERRPAFWRLGWGMERNRNGGSAIRSVLALPVLTGAFGMPGSGVHLHTDHDLAWDIDALWDAVSGPEGTPGARSRGEGRRHLNQNRLGAALTQPGGEPPVRVLFVQGANPAVMNPAQTKVLAGLAREDLFTVVHDQVLTDTARFADVVLPATTHFEIRDVAVPYGSLRGPGIRRRDRARGRRAAPTTRSPPVWPPASASPAGPGEAFDPSPERLLELALPAGVPMSVVTQAAGTAVQFRDVWPVTADLRAHLAGPGAGPAAGAGSLPTYRAARRGPASHAAHAGQRQDHQLDLR